MIFACQGWLACFKWVVESQLFSTIVILVFGTWLFDRWNKRREARRTIVWWLIQHIEEYAEMANEYWSKHPSKNKRERVLAARLKSEYNVLLSSVDDINGLGKHDVKQLREEITNLFEFATGGDFETQKKTTEQEIGKILTHIASSSANIRRRLRAYVV